MARTDPNLQNQALASLGYDYRVPMTGADALAEQDALLAAQQQADLGMAGLGQQAVPPEQVMSVAPPRLPAEENLETGMSEPIMSGYQPASAAPIPRPAPAPAQVQPRPAGASLRTAPGSGAGGAPRGPLGEAIAQRQAAEDAVRAYEEQGAAETARAQQAEKALGETRSATYREIADVNARLAALGEDRQKRLEADQQDFEKTTAQTQAEMGDLSRFMSNYEPKDRRTTGQKVMSALAVGLSAVADQNSRVAGLMQGMNVQTDRAEQVSQLIQRGIDRDIDLQRQMLENKRTAHAAMGTELGQARELFRDRMDADKVAYVMKLDQAGSELEVLKARGLSQEATALADGAIAKLGLERANAMRDLSAQRQQQLLAQEQRLRREAAAAAAARARAQRPPTAKEALDLEEQALKNAKLRADLAGGEGVYLGKDVHVTDPQAYQAWVRSKPTTAEQEKLRAGVQGYAQLRSALTKLTALKEQYGSEGRVFTSDQSAAMDQERERVIAALNLMKDGSVMQEGEYQRAMSQVPGAGDFALTALPKLKAIESSVRDQANAKLQQIGASVVSPADLTRPLSR